MIKKAMESTLIMYLTVPLLIIILISCIKKENTSDKLVDEIETQLKVIENPNDSQILLSSKADDYISFNRRTYNEIVHLGQPAFDYMLNQLAKAKAYGIKEYIMAKACSDILGDKNPIKEWRSAEEWYNKYILYQKSQQ